MYSGNIQTDRKRQNGRNQYYRRVNRETKERNDRLDKASKLICEALEPTIKAKTCQQCGGPLSGYKFCAECALERERIREKKRPNKYSKKKVDNYRRKYPEKYKLAKRREHIARSMEIPVGALPLIGTEEWTNFLATYEELISIRKSIHD